MSESVEVPIEALQALKNGVITRQGSMGGCTEVTVVDHALQSVLAFIPEPPKVGDKINGAQFAALPPRSVAIDSDGDVWVHTGENTAALIEKASVYASHDGFFTHAGEYYAADVGMGTLVHIGTEEDN